MYLMSSSLTNIDDVVANSLSSITATVEVDDVLDTVQGSVVRLPPSTCILLGKSHQRYQTTQIIF